MRFRQSLQVGAAVAVLAVICVVAAAPTASSGRQATIQSLNFGWTSISTLDYARSYSINVGWIEFLGVESLMRMGPDGKVQPWLAASVERPNRFVYIYKLRKGVKFWDGSELTAEDAANALNYYRHKGFSISGENGNPNVRSIIAKDRYTVIVTLKRPDAAWEAVPAIQAPIFQKKFQETHGARMGTPSVMMMGTGPFRFESFDPTRGIELSANPNWWRGNVPVKHISVKFINDPTAMALAFRAGEIDFAPSNIDPKTFAASSGGLRPSVVRSCGSWWYTMNVKKPPFDDVHVRRAVAYALDRRAMISAGGGVQEPVLTIPSRRSLLSLGTAAQVDKVLKQVPTYPFSLAKARAEMAKSKYPNGATTSMPVPAAGFPTANWEALVALLAPIGIKLELKRLTGPQTTSLITGPRENIDSLLGQTTCPNADPSFFSGRYHSKQARLGGTNYSNYTNAKVDALLDQAKFTYNKTKRLELYGQILKLTSQDVARLAIFSSDSVVAFSKRVAFPGYHNFTPFGSGWAVGFVPKQ